MKKKSVTLNSKEYVFEYQVIWKREYCKEKIRKYKTRAWAERCFNFIAHGIKTDKRENMPMWGFKKSRWFTEEQKVMEHSDFPKLEYCALLSRYTSIWFPVEEELFNKSVPSRSVPRAKWEKLSEWEKINKKLNQSLVDSMSVPKKLISTGKDSKKGKVKK